MNAARRRPVRGSTRPDPSASVASFCRAATFLVAALMLSACVSRPVGDFGRAVPGFTHDVAMPEVGKLVAYARDEPVSRFNLTDQEKLMHNRVWRFLVAPHAKDWFYDTAVELQRTRLTPETDLHFAVDRYYAWLRSTDYQSSRTRYSTVGRHITADIDTVPSTFVAICAVIEVDRQRAAAYAGLPDLEPTVGADVWARKAENDAYIAWFVRALGYRFESYDYALDHLLAETPHEQSLAVDEALRRMSVYVARAQRHDFCGEGGGAIHASGGAVIPSRIGHGRIDNEIVFQK